MRLIALLAMLVACSAQGQTYPVKPIRLVVTFSAGGTSDIVARLIQGPVQERLGQPVIVENRPGGGATIGANVVAQAEPDGYTLLLNNTAPMSLSPVMMDKPPYDPLKSFTHVAYIGAVPNVMLVHPSVPAKNIDELVAFAKTRSGGLDYSGAGAPGTIGHIVGELLAAQTGIKLVHIGYKGSAPMQQDLLAGRLLFAIDGLPQNVPPTIVERLYRAVSEGVAVPAVQTRLGELGFTTRQMTPAQFSAFVENQVKSWADPVRASGAKLN
jgi:tripartite-type tricarboxylate transporter receptor subunit TctC